jgi:hypothetical protein
VVGSPRSAAAASVKVPITCAAAVGQVWLQPANRAIGQRHTGFMCDNLASLGLISSGNVL